MKRHIPCSWIECLNVLSSWIECLKKSILFKLIYRFNLIPIKFPTEVPVELDKPIIKLTWVRKGPTLEFIFETTRLRVLDIYIKTFDKSIVIKTTSLAQIGTKRSMVKNEKYK